MPLDSILNDMRNLPDSWRLLRFLHKESQKEAPASTYRAYGVTSANDAKVQRFANGIVLEETQPIHEELGNVSFNAAMRLLQDHKLVQIKSRQVEGGGMHLFVDLTPLATDVLARGDATSDVRITLGGLLERFHLVARQLGSRYSSRTTIEIQDEYDVQDLMHSLLHLVASDIRREEWTPSYAGGSSRMDFLLKEEKIVVEVKRARKGLTTRTIADQLIVDIARYQSHPGCDKLVCFVYDPEGSIGNPTGLERDLSKRHDRLAVTVVVTPKGT